MLCPRPSSCFRASHSPIENGALTSGSTCWPAWHTLHIRVAASYSYGAEANDPKAIAAIQSEEGSSLTLANGRAMLLTHDHAFSIVGQEVALAKSYLGPLITKGENRSGYRIAMDGLRPMKVIIDPAEIDMAVNPTDDYAPEKRILHQPSPVSRRRFALPDSIDDDATECLWASTGS